MGLAEEIFDLYDDADKDIRFLTASKVRSIVLLSILYGGKSSGEIAKATGIDTSSIIHAARELEEERYIVNENGYHLTPKGKIFAINLMSFVDTFHTLSMNGFWEEHYIDDIPPKILRDIHKLRNSQIIKDTPSELMKGFLLYIKLLRNSKNIRGISSIFHPRFPNIIEKLAKRDATMEFIITSSIFEKLREEKLRRKLIEIMKRDNFSLYLIEKDVKLAFTVTESFLSFSLYFKNGMFDDNSTLISYDEKALRWANSLFEHYMDISKPLHASDL